MNKKGFTIIEIIVCISIMIVIGVGSFIGIRMVNKKINIDKLNQITDKAVQAAQVYIETNKEATNQLYNNKNGVSFPLQLLVNEGLLNLDGTKLEEDDLKNQYVVTFLGGTGSSENCEQITSTTSWSNNKPIYLCMNSTNGSSNLATIDPTKYGNKTYVSNEPYYFKGLDPNNWVEIEGLSCSSNNNSRIVYVDIDNSIVIVVQDTRGCNLNNNRLTAINYIDYYSTWDTNAKEYHTYYNGEYTKFCWWSWLYTTCYDSYPYRFNNKINDNRGSSSPYPFYRLPKECKIKSGTGAIDNKFKVKCN